MRMLTAQQVADILRVHKSTVYYWMRTRGDFPVVRSGRHVRVPEELLERWITEKESAREM